MLERVQSLDAIVAMRFHAIVFASLASVPTVAVPYDDKCRSFVESRQIVAVEPSQLTAEALLAALPLAWAVAA
jgi:polysaccharide pyruvyl transferase WcaK-like protein